MPQAARLSPVERMAFLWALRYPWLFRRLVRPQLYRRCGHDPEAVHQAVLAMVGQADVVELLRTRSRLFLSPTALMVTVHGRRLAPFGTAAGMDKNGEALEAFSYVFGFQEPGTVVVAPRDGNPRPRVARDDRREDLYNAQGFPSKGLPYFLDRIRAFRQSRGEHPTIYVSVCGLPLAQEGAIQVAMDEMEQLVKSLAPYVNGFVWNPFSPNTAALAALRTPRVFRDTAELMGSLSPNHLRLVKMGPYEDDPGQRKAFLSLVEGFLEGGGHGVVVVNTQMVPREQVPARQWGYPSAGRSGRSLRPYRLRAVREVRQAFPGSVVVATGGIFDADDAYESFKAGATLLEGYTPYTFYGLGLLPRLQRGVARRLRQDGYHSLEQLQAEARKGQALVA